MIQAALRVRSLVATPWLTTLCYHRTAEHASGGELDGDIIDATPAQFDQQMKFLSQHFAFVSVDEVVAFSKGTGKLPMNPILVTFDDGYRECFTATLPILRRYGARATFFIPTLHMTERRLFWWDRFAWIVRHSTAGEIHLSYPRDMTLFTRTEEEKRRAHQTLTNLVKETKALDIDHFMEDLEQAAGTSLSREDERSMVDKALMTWAEVEGLANAGMSIGSHSYSHRVLQTLMPTDFDKELGGSRRELEERLGRPVKTIAYPVGYPLGDNQLLRDAVKAAGYELGFTCRAGVLGTKNLDPLDVPRILMDTSYDLQHFSAVAALPPLAPRSAAGVARRG